jgi:hypothetical protein
MIRNRIYCRLREAIRRTGFDVTRHPARDPDDYRSDFYPILKKVRPLMGTSSERTNALYESIIYIISNDIPGVFAECGVYRGGSAATIACTLLQLGVRDRDIFLYDTFEGMPPPSEQDRDYVGNTAAALLQTDESIYCRCSIESVKEAMVSTGYPAEHIIYVKGLIEETVPTHAPLQIALLRLDTDWYESTKHELIHLYPRLAAGGILLIDDYGHWAGARKAVDEYFRSQARTPFLSRIDYSGRVAVKPS